MPRQKHFEGDICETSGCDNYVAHSGYNDSGTPKYRAVCQACHKGRYSKPWLKFRLKSCESCGHTPLYPWALEVHHRDGDKSNNIKENMTTLCANCHRDLSGLIHELEDDWEKAESVFARLVKTMFS